MKKRARAKSPGRVYLEEAVGKGQRLAALRLSRVQKLGLFFLYKGRLFMEGAPWTEVQSEAGFRTYPVDHPVFWAGLQKKGLVPRGMPYEECPRGRVTHRDATGRFRLFADKCIIKNKKAVSRIMRSLSLPPGTRIERDEHYRCPGCMPRTTKKQEEEDWDL
jgi:hypothetical protein